MISDMLAALFIILNYRAKVEIIMIFVWGQTGYSNPYQHSDPVHHINRAEDPQGESGVFRTQVYYTQNNTLPVIII